MVKQTVEMAPSHGTARRRCVLTDSSARGDTELFSLAVGSLLKPVAARGAGLCLGSVFKDERLLLGLAAESEGLAWFSARGVCWQSRFLFYLLS